MLLKMGKAVVYGAFGSPIMAALKARLIARRRGVTVLNLHRVAPPDGSVYKPLTPELFVALLAFCKKNFEILSLGELTRARWEKPPLVLSFDDGYKDFIEYAVPLLKKHGLPANQNVVPSCIDTGRPPINVMAQDFMGQAPWTAIADLRVPGWSIRPEWGRKRDVIGRKLANHLKTQSHERRQALETVLLPQMLACEEFRPTPMMTLADVRSLLDDFEIGAHSFEHDSMAHETDSHVAADASRCKTYFREKLGAEATIYAFPNGSLRPNHVDVVRSAGFRTLLLVDEEFTRPDSDVVERFTFYAASAHQVRFRATGGLRMP